jgi:hypothetical protein
MKLNCRQERNDIDRQHFACLFEVGSCDDFKFREKYLFGWRMGRNFNHNDAYYLSERQRENTLHVIN